MSIQYRKRIHNKLGNYKDHELEFDNLREKVQKLEEQRIRFV